MQPIPIPVVAVGRTIPIGVAPIAVIPIGGEDDLVPLSSERHEVALNDHVLSGLELQRGTCLESQRCIVQNGEVVVYAIHVLVDPTCSTGNRSALDPDRVKVTIT